jgi:antitoxin (DNA-binding transcriptional repressor) of toxin-antitoxin stability system
MHEIRAVPRMSVATIQQFSQDFSAWMALVRRGETVAITEGGRVVAKLSPATDDTAASATTAEPAHWPVLPRAVESSLETRFSPLAPRGDSLTKIAATERTERRGLERAAKNRSGARVCDGAGRHHQNH